MRSETPETATTVHYRIYVYQNAYVPLGEPIATSLCPGGRATREILSGALSQVTCTSCWKFIREIGVDQPW